MFLNFPHFDNIFSGLLLYHLDFFSNHIVISLTPELEINFFGDVFSEVSLYGDRFDLLFEF